MVDKADTWQQQYADWQRDIEDAKHGMDDQFGLYAQKADGYDKLTDAQKAFVTNYIKATGDIVDADGRILSEDEIIEKAKGYTKFVEKLATDPNFDGARENINKLFSLDKSKMSAGEYEKQVEAILKELQDKFKLSDDEVLGFKIALGFTFVSDGNTTVKTMVDGVKAKLQNEAQQEAESKKIDLSQIIFGNIDLNNRKILDWTDENIEKYKSALESWGQSIEKYRGDISTVDGRSEEFDGVEIAFSPILQTENGAEYLDSDTVHRYINSLIEKAGEGWTNEDLFKLDAKGLEVDGKQIKGLIADIGETAIKTGESMHFLGTDGAINLGWKNIEEELNSLNFEDLQKAYNIISNLLEGTLLSWDKLQEKINATSDSVKGVTSSLTSLKDAVKSAEDAFELFNDVQKDFKSSGVISSENIQKILAKFPDLEDELYEYIMGLRTGASVIDLLKTKSDNMATMSAEAFRKMYMSSTAVSASMKKQFASAFKYVGLEWDNTQSVMANVNSQIIDNNGNVCTTFADQWTNACKAAGVSVSTFASGLASLFSGGVDNIIKENGNLYSEDKVSGEKVNLVDVQAVKIAQDLNDKKSESEYWNRYGKYVSNGKVDKDAIYSDVSKRFHGIYNEGISNKEELEKKQKEFEEALKKNVIDSGSSSSKDKKDKSKDTPFDDSYYSAIDAWLEEAKKQIENLEKESEKLNRQLENAMDSANKEQTEILRKKIAENAKAQKDLLHEQNEAHRITQQELLQSLYAYAPSLKGLSFDEISEVDLYNIETTLTKANENAADDDAKNSTSYSLNQFKGIVDDLKALSNEIEDNSEKWWTLDENAKGYWQSQIDFQSEYSQTWIDNQKAFDKLTDEEELAAYSRMINNNKGFQKQILNDVSLSEEAKLVLIKETNDKIVEIEKEAYSLRQEMIENLKSDLTEEIDEKISAFEDLTNDKIDRLNHRASQYSSLRTLLQSYYDTINAVSDAQHEINKELAVSMTLYEYLNEETRKLLFNQEDYNTLNQKLLEIESQANLLQEEYNDDILAATKENIEEITSQYQMQYETLMKSYEIAKAELEVAKKKQQLNNVLAERNVRMFIDGQWQWVANTQDVQNAQTELADAQYEAQKAKTSLEQQESLNELTKSQDKITTQINYIETDLETIREKWQEMQKQIEDESFNLTSVLSELAEIDSPKLQSVIASVSDSLEEFAKEIKSIKDDLDSSSSGSSSSRHAFGGSFVKGVSNTVKVSTAHAR